MIPFLIIILVFAFVVSWFIHDRKRKPYVYQVKIPETKHKAVRGRTVEPDRKPEFNEWQSGLKELYQNLSA